ncbi:hypothetical protein ABK905_18250 [Acerihabitans sp. KWT182]|uniref:Xylose isomerase-like TIM barrel domain-containing protein n=1 Tax=Acerihabitans sp. KWT182 TaxID=3157919 RepID=A0AAU7Q5Z0_9GAMM
MRLSISNIAWDTAEDHSVARLLQRENITAIDIVPGKYFQNLSHVRKEEVFKLCDKWAQYGIEIVGMQALLFGTSGLSLFGSMSSRKNLLHHLIKVLRISGITGAGRLVFGSPKNRDRGTLTDDEVKNIAVPFFSSIR